MFQKIRNSDCMGDKKILLVCIFEAIVILLIISLYRKQFYMSIPIYIHYNLRTDIKQNILKCSLILTYLWIGCKLNRSRAPCQPHLRVPPSPLHRLAVRRRTALSNSTEQPNLCCASEGNCKIRNWLPPPPPCRASLPNSTEQPPLCRASGR